MTDEEKKALEILNNTEWDGFMITIKNLIEKQSKEIEEHKKELDLDNECEIALNNKIMDLEKEIEELKEEMNELQKDDYRLIKVERNILQSLLGKE